jgi:hypothetical protein
MRRTVPGRTGNGSSTLARMGSLPVPLSLTLVLGRSGRFGVHHFRFPNTAPHRLGFVECDQVTRCLAEGYPSARLTKKTYRMIDIAGSARYALHAHRSFDNPIGSLIGWLPSCTSVRATNREVSWPTLSRNHWQRLVLGRRLLATTNVKRRIYEAAGRNSFGGCGGGCLQR